MQHPDADEVMIGLGREVALDLSQFVVGLEGLQPAGVLVAGTARTINRFGADPT